MARCITCYDFGGLRMPINNGIASMNPASPADLDPVSQGAAQIRTIKSNLQSQFPNIGTVEPTNPTSTEFNQLVGIKTTESIQSQIDKLVAEDVIINGKYMPKAGGEFSGFVNYLTSLGNPTQPDQLAPKKYVDLMLPLAGGTLVGAGAQIKNPNLPIADQDLTNKKFVVDSIAAANPVMRRTAPPVVITGNNSSATSAQPLYDPTTENVVGIEHYAQCIVDDLTGGTASGFTAGQYCSLVLYRDTAGGGSDALVYGYFTATGNFILTWAAPRVIKRTVGPVITENMTPGKWQIFSTIFVVKK